MPAEPGAGGPGLVDKIVELHLALDRARLPHAFGGALALAWCTRRARGTVDVDVNVFVPPERAGEVFGALPPEVAWSAADLETCGRDGQVRLWWGVTPIDVFTSTTDFHRRVADRVVVHDFASHPMPFLSCDDLAVFKAFFDRTRDWADLEEMGEAGTLDAATVVGALVEHLGVDDPRVARVLALRPSTEGEGRRP